MKFTQMSSGPHTREVWRVPADATNCKLKGKMQTIQHKQAKNARNLVQQNLRDIAQQCASCFHSKYIQPKKGLVPQKQVGLGDSGSSNWDRGDPTSLSQNNFLLLETQRTFAQPKMRWQPGTEKLHLDRQGICSLKETVSVLFLSCLKSVWGCEYSKMIQRGSIEKMIQVTYIINISNIPKATRNNAIPGKRLRGRQHFRTLTLKKKKQLFLQLNATLAKILHASSKALWSQLLPQKYKSFSSMNVQGGGGRKCD